MVKVLLRKRIIDDAGIIKHQIYCTKAMKKNGMNESLEIGWNDENPDQQCSESNPCPPIPGGINECSAGRCVFIPTR